MCNDPDRQRRFQPRGMAVVLNNNFLYVTRFLAFTKPGGRQGTDTGKEGAVCQIAINTASTVIGGYVPQQLITFASRLTGFKVDSPGPGNTVGDGVVDPTRAFPNQMQSLVIRGNRGFMPNIAASPTSPLVFNNDTQAFITFLNNVGSGVLADGGAFNLHLGAREPEAGKKDAVLCKSLGHSFHHTGGGGFGLCGVGG